MQHGLLVRIFTSSFERKWSFTSYFLSLHLFNMYIVSFVTAIGAEVMYIFMYECDLNHRHETLWSNVEYMFIQTIMCFVSLKLFMPKWLHNKVVYHFTYGCDLDYREKTPWFDSRDMFNANSRFYLLEAIQVEEVKW